MSQSVYPPFVEGPVAHDDPIIGKPVVTGGRASSAVPTSVGADGDVTRAWLTRPGAIVVAAAAATVSIPDALTNNGIYFPDRTNNSWPLIVDNMVFNGTTWDRLRGTTLGVDVARAAAAATSAVTSVASSATNVTLLASLAGRKGATIYNDSAQILYVKFGATASATSYTVQMAPGAYFEVPFGYTGIIDGIWASADGDARITELS